MSEHARVQDAHGRWYQFCDAECWALMYASQFDSWAKPEVKGLYKSKVAALSALAGHIAEVTGYQMSPAEGYFVLRWEVIRPFLVVAPAPPE